MNRISAAVLGAFALMAATTASGRARSLEISSASQATPAQSVPAGNESSVSQSTPLFAIGGLWGSPVGSSEAAL
jgi:hypothetical protein